MKRPPPFAVMSELESIVPVVRTGSGGADDGSDSVIDGAIKGVQVAERLVADERTFKIFALQVAERLVADERTFKIFALHEAKTESAMEIVFFMMIPKVVESVVAVE